MIKTFAVFILFCLSFSSVCAMDLDEQLRIVQEVYDLSPKSCKTDFRDSKESIEAGKNLFESKLLSGENDTACKTCHIKEHGFGDGLPISVGVNGDGEGPDRMRNGRGVLVQRNAFTLIGRGSREFKSFFWDGKAELVNGQIVSQFGEKLPKKFESTLAVAAILPLVERDEFLGKSKMFFENEIKKSVGDSLYYERFQKVSEALRARINQNDSDDALKLKTILIQANVDVERITLAEIGNLLAVFIRNQFPCTESKFDRYLSGNPSALTEQEKIGAVIFYGKGRCASCHSGSVFSDFKYHSIGVPQGGFGPHSRHRDIGRAGVTNLLGDMYKFRTPPLIDVENTAPYGHSGVFNTLREVIMHHINPISIYLDRAKLNEAELYSTGKTLDSRSDILKTIDITNDSELEALVKFVKVL